jgi:hypothetical protein
MGRQCSTIHSLHFARLTSLRWAKQRIFSRKSILQQGHTADRTKVRIIVRWLCLALRCDANARADTKHPVHMLHWKVSELGACSVRSLSHEDSVKYKRATNTCHFVSSLMMPHHVSGCAKNSGKSGGVMPRRCKSSASFASASTQGKRFSPLRTCNKPRRARGRRRTSLPAYANRIFAMMQSTEGCRRSTLISWSFMSSSALNLL